MTNRPVIVVENDPFPRLLQAFLDPAPIPERDAAIAEFVAHDLPDFAGWLARVRRGAFLVNVARAELVEREALYDALASGHLGGLGLDTFYEEPGRADDPLLKFDNAIITPRIAAQPRFNALCDLEEVIAGLSRTLGGSP